MGCISEDDLLGYLERRLVPEEAQVAEAHLRECDECRRALAELARSDPEAAVQEAQPVCRYEVLAPLGAGAMGIVYAARDPKLGRTVALKMLQAGGTGEGDAKARERLLREARAMARLSHPNVLTVHDVGELDGRVFLAMELVQGGTLTAWLHEKSRSWRDVLDVLLAAARGLAAAHAAGLVHRDFKPENVLIGDDGRVRVTDFGLASAFTSLPEAANGGGDQWQPRRSMSGTALAGSPAYMAPEQLRGEALDARADVFSYSVTLYEALYGERPFAGESLADLEVGIRQGKIHGPTRRSRTPRWLRRALLRGLRHDPGERFQSIDAMIAALEKGRRAEKRIAAGAVLSVIAVLAVLIGIAWWRQYATEHAPGAGIRSLAVLPLEEPSGEAHPSVADTVAEALTTDLGRTRGLRVTSRRSVDAFRQQKTSAKEIGRQLNVDGLVQGSVKRDGGQIRIDLRLVRTAGGEPVWSERFEGRNAFTLENDGARAVRTALGLSPDRDEASRWPPTRNAEAFDLFLRGRIHLLRENESDNGEAIRLLERAVAADPSFAAAQAELAHAYGLRVAQFAPRDTSALERAEAAAQAALRLDPQLPEAHYVTAFLLWGVLPDRFWHERAAQEFERALALNPNLADAHHHLGQVYLHLGLFDRAIIELQKALLLDPTDSNARRRIAFVHAYRGEYEEALRIVREVPEQAGISLHGFGIAWTLQHLGRRQEALAHAEQELRRHPEDRGGVITSTRAMLFAEAGDVRRALADVRSAIEKGKGFVHFHHATYNIASAYALLGKPDEAVHWLRWTAENGFPCYPLFAADPNLERIRRDPGYLAFMSELKSQWERYRAMF